MEKQRFQSASAKGNLTMVEAAYKKGLPLLAALLCGSEAIAKGAWEWDAELGLEAGYDDNVAVDEIDLNTAEGDGFFTLDASVAAEYKLTKNTEFSGSYSFSERQYQDFNNLDLTTQLASIGVEHEFGEIKAGLQYRFVDSKLGGDGFLQIRQWSPHLSGFISKQHFVRGAVSFNDKTLDNNPSRDATSVELALDYYYFLSGLQKYFIVATRWKEEDAEDPLFDYRSSQIRLGYQQRGEIFGLDARYRANVRYRIRDYDEVIHPDIGDFREDKRLTLSADAQVSLTSDWAVTLKLEHRDNDSNLPTVDFSEQIVSLGVKYEF